RPSASQAPIRWKMVTSWPRNTPGVGVNAQRLADLIQALTADRLTVTLYAAGDLVPPFEVLDAVSGGAAELGHTALYYGVGKASALHFFTNVPFGLDAGEFAAWLTYGGGDALKDEVLAPLGLRSFYAGSSGTQAMGWFRRPIQSLQDLQGLKMRIAGLGGAAMAKVGVTSVLIPPGEIFTALESGTVDAAEWVGPWNDLAFGLHKAASHYYLPAFHEPGPALDLVVNRRAFDALPSELQLAVATACRAVALDTSGDFLYHNIRALETLKAQGVRVASFPEDVVAALQTATREVVSQLMADDAAAKRVGESYLTFARQASRYAEPMAMTMLAQRARYWD
ncbi:MAG: TRAP transporter substrate-binding protein, partial [Candidatus Competibacterales bacterium]